jgi:hypothetical protein
VGNEVGRSRLDQDGVEAASGVRRLLNKGPVGDGCGDDFAFQPQAGAGNHVVGGVGPSRGFRFKTSHAESQERDRQDSHDCHAHFSILYDRLARCYTTDWLSAKVRLVERVRGFKELTDEKSSECLKMNSGLDWPCCGSEFILSKAEETLRYALEKERRRGKLYSDYWFARVGRCRHRVL